MSFGSGLPTVARSGLADFLSPISYPIANTFNLPHLPTHFPLLLLSFLSFQLLEWIAPFFFARISPVHFGRANRRTRQNWTAHAVSMAHALVIVPLAISCIYIPELDRDRAFGFDPYVGDVYAVSCGFLWDTIDSIFHFTDIGFVIHGLACLMIYSMSFRPFLGYYGPRFLLWESSTVFLNIHWYLDKTNRTGGYLQIGNGIVLMITFFLARICYGGLMSLQFFYTLREIQSQISTVMAGAYALGNLVLQGLNWFWFYKMAQALRKRVAKQEVGVKEHTNGHAEHTNGHAPFANGKVKVG